ncbi:MAG: response regulator [Burkholderiales bacterium]|jgi:CheY-like chemotaxis protein|nr:response regulator [Burkholderiales bacterium]
MEFIPAYFYPTTLVFVDDLPLALDAYKSLFAKSGFNCIFYENSKSALEFFENYSTPLTEINFISKICQFDSEKPNTQYAVQLDISQTIELAKSQTKYNEVSVLLTDYNMKPGKNGIELCQVLKRHKFKKLLLTELQTYQAALKALNNGVINYFVSKMDAPEMIKEAVTELSIHFFNDKTADFRKYLETNSLSPLSDPVFIEYFLEIIKKLDIIEYYLIDKNGSYLLIDSNRQNHVLIVHNDQSLAEFTTILEEYNSLNKIVKSISEKKIIPFFGINKEISDIDVANDINAHLYCSTVLDGKQKYYVHLLKYDLNL